MLSDYPFLFGCQQIKPYFLHSYENENAYNMGFTGSRSVGQIPVNTYYVPDNFPHARGENWLRQFLPDSFLSREETDMQEGSARCGLSAVSG